MKTITPTTFDALADLIGEFGREVHCLLDDCETSGPVGEETHTITPDGLHRVSDLLDRIDALPFEEPGCILGTGGMLQAALKQTVGAMIAGAYLDAGDFAADWVGDARHGAGLIPDAANANLLGSDIAARTPADARAAYDAAMAQARAKGFASGIKAAALHLRTAADDWRSSGGEMPARKIEDEIPCVLALSDAPAPVHPDDIAVDRFAAAMKAKLAKKRADGRGGWQDKSRCSQQLLSALLRGHVRKPDPVDVANIAMMLHQRGEEIAPARDVTVASLLETAMPESFIGKWHEVTEWCSENDETVEAQTAWGNVMEALRALAEVGAGR